MFLLTLVTTDFVRTVRRKAEKQIIEKGPRKIHCGPQVYVEDEMGESGVFSDILFI